MAWFIILGCVRQPVTFLAFLIENQSFNEKLEENDAEFQRIETVTLHGVPQQHLLSMLLPVFVYPIQFNISFLGFFFMWQKCLSIMDV